MTLTEAKAAAIQTINHYPGLYTIRIIAPRYDGDESGVSFMAPDRTITSFFNYDACSDWLQHTAGREP